MPKWIWITGVALILVVVAVFVFRSRSYPIVNADSKGQSIVAFGDSLTAGTGAPEGKDYPSILSQQLGAEILNRGVPGDTTEMALARLDKDVLEENPRIVIVCLAGNDGLQAVPIDATFANLTQIIESIQRRGAMIVLVGVRSASITDQYDKRFRELGRAKGCVFVPNILRGILSDPSLRSDQVHPNEAGYRIIADRIGEALKPYVK